MFLLFLFAMFCDADASARRSRRELEECRAGAKPPQYSKPVPYPRPAVKEPLDAVTVLMFIPLFAIMVVAIGIMIFGGQR